MNYYDSVTILHRSINTRRYFDPSKRDDLTVLKFFKKHNKWKDGCPFYLEWPHADIISMCNAKYSDYMLKQLK
jgi:hypothetical protein